VLPLIIDPEDTGESMKTILPTDLPRMREHGLIIDELPDEVLVYDVDRDKAHCLNRTAALVWQSCDGNTAPPEIARRLQLELGAQDNEARPALREEMVWLALGQLERIHLLEHSVSVPTQFARLSRRQMIRGLGLAAAVAVPVVTSIVAPRAVEAATCRPPGAVCDPPFIPCCNGSLCGAGGNPNHCN
jgi:hypothetical protein